MTALQARSYLVGPMPWSGPFIVMLPYEQLEPGHGRRHRPKITKDKPSFALWVAIGAQSEFE